MLARESVRSRMSRADAGLSYTEFSYQVLQAYDFLCLFRQHGCTVQIGGSDQWGNITAGTDLIRRVEGAAAFGLTLPLIEKADGTKFGKTEGGTVWLDAAKTSPYEMYQFWLNTSDADVVGFLKYFTFLGREPIDDLQTQVRRHPETREAQRVLAREVTTLVHGDAATREAEEISAAFFSGDLGQLTERQLVQACQGMPTTVTTEAAGAIPDGVLAAEMAADQDPQPGARAAAGLFGELQRHAVRGHDVVAPDGAFVLDAKDLVEIDAAQRHKGGGGIGRRPAELGVEGGQEAVAHIAIGRGHRGDAGGTQFVDEAVLQGAVGALAAAARLGRIAQDVFDAQPGQRAADLGRVLAIRRAPRRRGMDGPVRAVGVQRHRHAVVLEDGAQRRQDRGDTLAALPQLGVQQTFGGVVDHGDEGEPLLGA